MPCFVALASRRRLCILSEAEKSPSGRRRHENLPPMSALRIRGLLVLGGRTISLVRFQFQFRPDVVHWPSLPKFRPIFHGRERTRAHAIDIKGAVQMIDLVL